MAGPVKLRRQAVPFRVLSVEPRDGARGVLRDDPIVVLLSDPADAERLHEATLEVRTGDEAGAVSLRIETLHGGRALVLQPAGPLEPGREHRLRVRGLRDARGREAPAVETGFTTGPLAGAEIWP